jgi:PAS domain S-box-containing protein
MTRHTLDGPAGAELRAIQWFTLTHAAGLLAFAVLMGGLLWYLHQVEEDQQRQTLYRDIEWAQQSIRLRLRDAQDELSASGPQELAAGRAEVAQAAARAFLGRYNEIAYLSAVDRDRRVRWLVTAPGVSGVTPRAPGTRLEDSAGFGSFHQARDSNRPAWSSPFLGDANELLVELHVPLAGDGAFAGTLIAGYSLRRVLTVHLAPELRERYQISLTDQGGSVLESTSPRHIHEANLSYELPLDPPGGGVRLRANVFDTRPRLLERSLMLAVVGLALGSGLSLALLWRHARRRLSAEAERDRLFRLSADPMCVLDEHGRIGRLNPAFTQLFGEDGARRSLTDIAHPYDRERLVQALREASHPGGAAAIEARFAHGTGWRWLQWSLRGDAADGRTTLYGVAHDVTERKRAETALAAETSFRQAMEDSMLTGMRAFDLEGRIIYVNRAFCAMTGYEREQLMGRTAPYPYWPPDDADAHREHLQRLLAGEAPASGFEVRIQRRDGSAFDARMYVSPLIDREGRQTGWMSSITDITEPKRSREALAAAHERFTTVLDTLDAAVWVLAQDDAGDDAQRDRAGPQEASGGADAGSAGFASQPLFENRAFRALFRERPEAARVVAAEAIAQGEQETFETRVPGLERWLEVRSRTLRWVDGRAARILMASDVTRRREAEDRQREQQLKLGFTARLVTMGEMASSIAHELNQPLTAIANYCNGLAARLRSRERGGDARSGADEILEVIGRTSAQAERAGMVIRRIRAFVKRSEPERRPCRAADLVAEAVGLADIEARRHGLRIETDVPPDLPPLLADPILIEQVLLNLIRNGLEAMQGSRRRMLRLAVRQRGEWLEFSVSDTGPGLTAEAAQKLFEPFFTTKAEGMGMGLNICRSIVESHQGRLWADEGPQPGCTLRFTLPAADTTRARAA